MTLHNPLFYKNRYRDEEWGPNIQSADLFDALIGETSELVRGSFTSIILNLNLTFTPARESNTPSRSDADSP